MKPTIPSIHILGSRQFGGADQFYVRLVKALHEDGQRVMAINRRGSPAAAALAPTGIRQCHVAMANQWDWWSRWRIARIVQDFGPGVVQTYMGRATRLTHLPREGGIVHVARLGGYYKIDGYYRHAHAWIGNTRGICDYLVRAGLPAAKVFHIGNFVDDPVPLTQPEKDALRRRYDVPPDAWILFALGRFIEKKGFQDLLTTLSQLPERIAERPIVLLLAGDGPDAASLRRMGQTLGTESRVRWLGWQVPGPFYALADAMICPSRIEPLGNVILEAWNYRLPVISTDTQAATELLRDGENGLIAQRAQPAALAEAIRRLLSASSAERLGLAEAGNRFVQANCRREAIVQAYLTLYESLLRNRGTG